jgi:hypothetical protein
MSDALQRLIPGFIYAGKDDQVDYLGAYYPTYEETASMTDPDERVYALVDTTDMPHEPGSDVRRAVAAAFARVVEDNARNDAIGFDLVAFEAQVEASLAGLRAIQRAAAEAGFDVTPVVKTSAETEMSTEE